nr:hypothetical protein [Boseongicola aestuarii]
MGRKTSSDGPKSAKEAREARLKAALKANLSRRKAQVRARTGSGAERTVTETGGAGKDRAD